MAQGDGPHRLPVKATLPKTIGKKAADTVHFQIDERIGSLPPWAGRRPVSRGNVAMI